MALAYILPAIALLMAVLMALAARGPGASPLDRLAFIGAASLHGLEVLAILLMLVRPALAMPFSLLSQPLLKLAFGVLLIVAFAVSRLRGWRRAILLIDAIVMIAPMILLVLLLAAFVAYGRG